MGKRKGKSPLIWPSMASLDRMREIGAIAASSRHLARRMVKHIDFSRPGLVVELGPGSGSITRALVKQAPRLERLLLLEVGGEFIPLLQKKFPQVALYHDSAERLDHYVAARRVNAIVSGLPLRSLPASVLLGIGKALNRVMDDKTLYIQFTYDLRPTQEAYLPRIPLQKIASAIVWRNLPPARVDVFRRVVKGK